MTAIEKGATGTALATQGGTAIGDWWSPTTFDQAMAFAERIAKTGAVPDRFRGKPDEIIAAWSLGAPLGLSLLSSLQNITVINGTPSIWGDAALAVCLASPAREFIHEELRGEGDEMEAVCVAKRLGSPEPVVRKFSVEDAKKAGLWGNPRKDPWIKYPRRMLQMRARSWALRDAFADALCGMPVAEEIRDITDEVTWRDAEAAPGATRTETVKEKIRSRVEPAEPETQTEPEAAEAEAAPQEAATDEQQADRRASLELRFDACIRKRSGGDAEKAAKLVEDIEVAMKQRHKVDELEMLETDDFERLVVEMEKKTNGNGKGGRRK